MGKQFSNRTLRHPCWPLAARSREVCSLQLGRPTHIVLAQACVSQVRIRQISVLKISTLQLSTLKVGPCEICTLQNRPVEICSTEICALHLGIVEMYALQRHPLEDSIVKVEF